MDRFSPLTQELPPLATQAPWGILALALLGIVVGIGLHALLLRQPPGNEQMQAMLGGLTAGVGAYLGRQMPMVLRVEVPLAVLLGASVLVLPPGPAAIALFGPEDALIWIGAGRVFGFLAGVFSASILGSLSMHLNAAGSGRVATAASKGYSRALLLAYRPGAIVGLLAASLGLLGSLGAWLIFGAAAADAWISFAAGGSLAALLLRLGSSVTAGAIEHGADQASRSDEGLPADDQRNPAAVARLVGDGASGSAGAAADSFESSELTTAAALVLGLLLGDSLQGTVGDGAYDLRLVIFPLLLRGVGLLVGLLGVLLVRTSEKQRNARAALNRTWYLTAVLAAAGFAALTPFVLVDPATGAIDWRPCLAACVGVVLALLLDKLTEYFTATQYGPVKAVSRAGRNGPGSNILAGLALGLESGVWSLVALAVALLVAAGLYSGDPAATRLPGLFYGVALVGVGLVSLGGNTLARQSFGPVAATASTVGRLVKLEKNPRNVVEDLDAVGRATRTAANSVASGAAALSASALMGAFLIHTASIQQLVGLPPLTSIDLANPTLLGGLLIGGALPLLCSALLLRATARAADPVAEQIRRQTHTPGLLEGSTPPDSAQTVQTATTAAQRELIGLALVLLLVPVLVGGLLGAAALVSLLIGLILAGFALAVIQANTSSAWASAQQYIEEGFYGGKNSAAHQAAIVGSTAGAPLRTSTGPALGPVSKISALLVLVVGPAIAVQRLPDQPLDLIGGGALLIGLVVLIAALWLAGRTPQSGTRPKGKPRPTRSRA